MKKAKTKGKAPVREARRVPVSLRMTVETKQKIDAAALASDRSQSAEIEALIERCITYDAMLSAMNTTMDGLTKGNVEAAFRKAGYTAIHSPHGNIWVPQGHPMERSGFIDQKETRS